MVIISERGPSESQLSIAKPVSEESLIKLLSGVGEKTKQTSSTTKVGPLKIYELIRGIEKHQFEVFYQPKIESLSRQVVGVEALTRLNHPRQGLIFPDRFIDAMEKTTLINDLTKYVLNNVVKDWLEFNKNGYQLNIAVNISPGELSNLDLPDYILSLIHI